MKYLLFSPGLSQTIAIARLLKKHFGKEAYLIGMPCSGERATRTTSLYDQVEFSFSRSVLDSADCVIPTGSVSTDLYCRLRPTFAIGAISFGAENLRASNKAWSLRLAESLAIPVPRSWYAFAELPGGNSPYFCKPVAELNRGLRCFVKNKALVPAKIREGDYVYQEFIQGQGTYGFAFLAERGEVIARQQHFEKRSYPRSGGSASVIEPYCSERLEDYAGRFISAMNYTGWGLVEFKHCPVRNDFVLMELNAKFWASLEFTLRSNAKFTELLFQFNGTAQPPEGLVWPARLCAAGAGEIVRSWRELQRYPWVTEPGDGRLCGSHFCPKFIKGVFRRGPNA